MGTSASSSGPAGGVPMVPPWVGSPENAAVAPTSPAAGGGGEPAGGGGAAPAVVVAPPPPELAPAGRFRDARRELGDFGRTGSRDSLRGGLAHYTRRGLGGSVQAAKRMAGTARKAGALAGVLGALGSGSPSPVDLGIDPTRIAGLTSRQLADTISTAISPADGSLDAEAGRKAINLAFGELLQAEPEANLAALSALQIEVVVELYVVHEICERIELDVGKTIILRAGSAALGVERMGQMMSYVRECVGRSFRKAKADGRVFSKTATARVVSSVIKDTFDVFEEFLK